MSSSVSHRCTECWPGSRGVDCKDDCPPGFYGRLCREECACSPCDKVYGCQNVPNEYMHNRSTGISICIVILIKVRRVRNLSL